MVCFRNSSISIFQKFLEGFFLKTSMDFFGSTTGFFLRKFSREAIEKFARDFFRNYSSDSFTHFWKYIIAKSFMDCSRNSSWDRLRQTLRVPSKMFPDFLSRNLWGIIRGNCQGFLQKCVQIFFFSKKSLSDSKANFLKGFLINPFNDPIYKCVWAVLTDVSRKNIFKKFPLAKKSLLISERISTELFFSEIALNYLIITFLKILWKKKPSPYYLYEYS